MNNCPEEEMRTAMLLGNAALKRLHAAHELSDGGRVCAEHANVRLILYLNDGHLLTKKVSAKRV